MTWFKVDDSFHSHPKVLAVSPAALGLWVVAGSWSGANLSDGFIPDHVLPRLLPDAVPLAKELVAAGLWRRARGGHRFHDWGDFNPSAEGVKKEREAARERMRKLREARREKPADNSVNNSNSAGQGQDCSGEQGANVREKFATPTRPDPTSVLLPSEVAAPAADAAPHNGQLFRTPAQPPKPRTPPTGETQPEITAKDIVAAFFDASREAGLDDPTTAIVGKVSRDAKRLLTKDKVDPQKVLKAARILGANGWQSLDVQIRRLDAERLQAEKFQQGRRNGDLTRRGMVRNTHDEARLAEYLIDL